jgi:hypothetical protein
MRYSHIHFTPDTFTGERFTAGAILRESDTVTNRVIRADPPCEHCIGPKAAALLRLVMSGLGDLSPSFVELPEHVGPHFTLGPSRELPAGVTDPLEYVRGSLPKRGNR